MFCGCRVTYGEPPNTHTCPVCLGHPGALPVTNEKAIELGVRAGLALNCDIAEKAVFARELLLPDLPKGYQISQYDAPICTGGYLDVPLATGRPSGSASPGSTSRRTRPRTSTSGSRAGCTAPSARSWTSTAAGRRSWRSSPSPTSPRPRRRAPANHLKDILRAIGVSEADMEKGQLRCDANVSIRNPDGTFGFKTELKNMNSFRFVERGSRESWSASAGSSSPAGVEQTTLHCDPDDDEVHELRSKYAHDYRYFPEPDLLPWITRPGCAR